MDAQQLRDYVIKPTLEYLGLYSKDAERLLLGTACVESKCGEYIQQIKGPACGIYQMEPATAKDIFDNFLKYKPDLRAKVCRLAGEGELEFLLRANLAFATAMCRIHYLRDKKPIPDTLSGQAAYWKRVYNTELGKGTTDKYLRAWKELTK